MRDEIDDLKEIVRIYPEYEDMVTELLKIGIAEIEKTIKKSNNIKRNNHDNKKRTN